MKKPITDLEIKFYKRKQYKPYYVKLYPSDSAALLEVVQGGKIIGLISRGLYSRLRKSEPNGALCYKDGVLFTDLLEIPTNTLKP